MKSEVKEARKWTEKNVMIKIENLMTWLNECRWSKAVQSSSRLSRIKLIQAKSGAK
jgi:hypothetical protein